MFKCHSKATKKKFVTHTFDNKTGISEVATVDEKSRLAGPQAMFVLLRPYSNDPGSADAVGVE